MPFLKMLSPFVFLSDPAQPRLNLMLQTVPPFAVVQVWSFEKEEAYLDFVERNSPQTQMMFHYRIAFTVLTTLSGLPAEDENLLKEAGNFYATDRIHQSPGRFRRYERN